MVPFAARSLLGLVVPPRCAACGEGCASDAALCAGCAAELALARPVLLGDQAGVEVALAAGEYAGCIRELAHALKFGRRLRLAEVAATAMLHAAHEASVELAGAVVPVPADPVRWRSRGFDPAEELALAVARRSGLDFLPCLRRRAGRRQVGRDRRARLARPPRVALRSEPPARVVLVDDVLTTGATIAASAAALRAGGSLEVVALTLARSAQWPHPRGLAGAIDAA
ncbi:MAG: ComF family protein [Solirubrobacterales bacterium]|nr:ComF family protein [Solirubrobacterales bacterium]